MAKTEVKATDVRAADIIGTLVVLNRGNFVIECGREFQELADAIINTNKKGELTIKLTVTPSGWKEGTGRPNQVDVAPEISIKKPRHDQGKSIFFITEDNMLTRDDPDQDELFKEQM
jgi:hypothetical protein